MKYLLLLLISCNCWATEYKFTFNMDDGRQLKVKMEGKNQWDALEKAGVFCGKFFGVGKRDLTEDEIAEITSVCANPSFK